MSCCPAGSWPSLKTDYQPKGETIQLDDLPVYIKGDQPNEKAILVIHDVFGVDSGRTKNIVDHLAQEGYLVVLPDFYRGDNIPSLDVIKEWAPKFDYLPNLQIDVREKVLPFLVENGVKSIGLLGFCWGSWMVFQVSGDETLDTSLFKAGVNFHPSLALEPYVFERSVTDLAGRVENTPQLLLSASNDPDFVQPDGEVLQILNSKFEGSAGHFFEEQQHGWVNRGDLEVEATKRDVEKALQLGIDFLAQYV
eukprot:TRINITY_DN12283_c0_g1_i1.p1 TRINITY_DN12283_c0_g1~~TRINITY_DN12283_c0_g1_i1.p1  ORF type:complete len:263 (+),score=78.04 TRINITY_DN12283_c0_g1_i1:38-790(+)